MSQTIAQQNELRRRWDARRAEPDDEPDEDDEDLERKREIYLADLAWNNDRWPSSKP